MAELVGTLLVAQSGGPTAVINASLAGVILEKHPDEVTPEERHRAKLGFWACFTEVSKLPGNGHLRKREPAAP